MSLSSLLSLSLSSDDSATISLSLPKYIDVLPFLLLPLVPFTAAVAAVASCSTLSSEALRATSSWSPLEVASQAAFAATTVYFPLVSVFLGDILFFCFSFFLFPSAATGCFTPAVGGGAAGPNPHPQFLPSVRTNVTDSPQQSIGDPPPLHIPWVLNFSFCNHTFSIYLPFPFFVSLTNLGSSSLAKN